VDPDHLVARGYGETRLVNGCSNGVPCTEEQHQANRRTEFKVLARDPGTTAP
jgi:outer membrane protein OmpA-like peptidoglycan-associated protein